jgi:hypothetical protein
MSEISQVGVMFSDLTFLPWSPSRPQSAISKMERPCVLRRVCQRECDNQKVQRYKYHSEALIRLALLDASQPEIVAGQKRPEMLEAR